MSGTSSPPVSTIGPISTNSAGGTADGSTARNTGGSSGWTASGTVAKSPMSDTAFASASTSVSYGAAFAGAGINGTRYTPASIAASDTSVILSNVATFCIPALTTAVVQKGSPYFHLYQDASKDLRIELRVAVDPSDECSSVAPYDIVASVPSGPAYLCSQFLDKIVSTCTVNSF